MCINARLEQIHHKSVAPFQLLLFIVKVFAPNTRNLVGTKERQLSQRDHEMFGSDMPSRSKDSGTYTKR